MRTSRFVLALVIFVNLGLFSLSNVFPIRHVFCMGCQIGRCPLPLLVFDVCIVATEGSCLAKDEAIGMWTSMSRLEVCWRQRRLVQPCGGPALRFPDKNRQAPQSLQPFPQHTPKHPLSAVVNLRICLHRSFPLP
jgi:hypothetical protein